MYIRSLEKISRKEVQEVGGKVAALGEMMQAGLPVPPGFVITTKTFQDFYQQRFTDALKNEILTAFDAMQVDRVAVRSSALAEDSQKYSMAGQLESYLNVSKEDLLNYIQKCWDSIFSERVEKYAEKNDLPQSSLTTAVIVQKMLESEKSGVMFTINPVNQKNEIVIDAGYGLGELLVQGEITPDNYIVDKKSEEIIEKNLGDQKLMLVYKDGENKKIPVSLKNEYVLQAVEISELVRMGKKIEDYFTSPQDIEWAIEKEKLYILQSRPITV